ncbi:sialic acid-binding Ig-like lectin 11 [Nannospalax galili]|uniref:sialic acid-binding Ig-like lectin 11 n=1 Tax=Nannospalax galili TaxID=1026970 RepID=UPI00111C0C4D|nr:sialic acid-binding Ig-like lectin 11 [Nannospalax galili]
MLLLALLLVLLRGGSLQEGAQFWLQVQDRVTVQEGLCVLVPCSVHYPWHNGSRSTPAYGYWYQRKENTKREELVATNDPGKEIKKKTNLRFRLLGDPGANNCSLRVSGAQQADSAQYYFRLERGHIKYSYQRYMLTVTVTGAPEVWPPGPPDVLPAWGLPALHHLLGRGCPERPRPGLQHLRDPAQSQPAGSWHPAHLPSDHPQGWRVHKEDGPAQSVLCPEGDHHRPRCPWSSQPPASLNWVLEDRVLSWSSPVDSRTLGLDLPRVKAGDSGRYTCLAENKLGSLNGTLNLSVLYPPEDLRVTIWQANRTGLEILGNGSSLPVLEGQSLRLVCVSHSNPPASVSWAWVTQTLSPVQLSDPGILELPVVGREHEGHFTCAAQNPLGVQTISLSLSVHSPPQILEPSCSWEAEGLHCSCSCRAWPAPSLHWRMGEGLLAGNSSNASFTVTSSSRGPWANSSLSVYGGFSSDLRLSCDAQNDFGAEGHCPVDADSGVKTVRMAAAGKDKPAAFVPVCRGTLNAADSTKGHPSPALAIPAPEEELEVHYASLSFKRLRPWEPQDRDEASPTEYSEIKIRK